MSEVQGEKVRRFFRSSDPLVLLGIAILILGAALLTYGLIPYNVPNYKLVAAGSVPFYDPQYNLITNPELYFKSHYNGTSTIDLVQCTPANYCYGYQIIGTLAAYSYSSRYYGAGMMALAAVSIFAGYWFEPLKLKGPHLRPITIRVDEDICVANGVCVTLAPAVFQLKKQEAPTIFAPLAYVVDPNGADNDAIIQAAQMCPTGAIIIEDAETGERIHPPPPKS